MTANPVPLDAAHDFGDDRSGTLIGAFAGVVGGAGVLFFWLMGAIGLLTQTGGFIVQLGLDGAWRFLFLAYPFFFVACLLAGGALAALKRDREAVGVFGLPVVAAVGFYLALIHVRPYL